MANSDKNILITPSVGLSTNPTIRFNGANNAPTTLRVLDDGTVSFEGTAGQLFSISDGLTGSIFSVNDISGIPSIEALDTGLVKLNQYGGSTVFGASAAIQNSLAVNARVSIATGSASTPGLIVKGAASQTADLQQWQDSSSNVIAKVERAGAVSIEPSATPNGYSLFVKGSGSSGVITARSTSTSSHLLQFQNSSSTAVLRIDSEGRITPVTTSSVGLIIRSAASQSADLQQWQDSAGTTRSRIDLYGGFVTSVYASLYPSWSGGTPLFVSGLAGQTGNLTEWKNSAGTVLSKIDSIGSIFAPYAAIGTTPLAGAMTTINIAGFPSTPGLVIRGAASQTADLQQWQNSAGTVLGRVTSTGAIGIGTSSPTLGVALEAFATSYEPAIQVHALNNSRGGIAAFTNQRIALYTTSVADNLVFGYANTVNSANFVERMRLANSNGGLLLINSTSATLGGGSVASQLGVVAGAATTVGAVIRAAASQTANLQEWQNSSGTALAKVDSTGLISSISGGFFGTVSSSVVGTNYLAVRGWDAQHIPFVVQGYLGQTGDLTRWVDTSANTLAKVDSSGAMYTITAPANTNTTQVATTAFVQTAADSKLNITDPAIDYYVTNSGSGAYLVNGVSNGTIYFERGKKYRIHVNASGHPFWIQTVSGGYSSGNVYSTGITNNGTQSGHIIVELPQNAPQLYYACQYHSSMAGSISVGAYLHGNIFDAKGDILTASADNTPVKLSVGTNGYILTANSAAANGIEWAAAPISLPSQSGNSGYYLTTDGTNASWGALVVPITTGTATITENTATTIDTNAMSEFTSVEYMVSLRQGTKVRTSKVILQTDGTSVDMTEFAITETGGQMTGVVVSATTSAGNALLQVTVTDAANTNVIVKFSEVKF